MCKCNDCMVSCNNECKCTISESNDDFIKFSLTGCSEELFFSNDDFQEIKFIETIDTESDSHIVLSLSSVDRDRKHEVLSKFRNKKVKITIESV